MKILPLPPGDRAAVGLAAGADIAEHPAEDGGGAVTAPGEDEGGQDPAGGHAGLAADDEDQDRVAVGEVAAPGRELVGPERVVGPAVRAA